MTLNGLLTATWQHVFLTPLFTSVSEILNFLTHNRIAKGVVTLLLKGYESQQLAPISFIRLSPF